MTKKGILLMIWVVLALLILCSVLSIFYYQGKSTLYKNRYIERADNQGFLKWQWQRLTSKNIRAPQIPIKGITPNIDLIHLVSDQTRITWVGHSTLLLQVDGLNILTDPHWGERASPFSFIGPKRHQDPGIPFNQLPHIDVVLISHNHYDHLDKGTIIKLMAQKYGPPKFLVPLGVDQWFDKNIPRVITRGETKNVIALNWDQEYIFQGKHHITTFKLLAVQHWSARTLFDRYETLWGSWAVLNPKFRFWFSGDLGYSKDIQDIYRCLGPIDLAAIAIGAYAPRWFMKNSHLDPHEAVQVMQDLHARQAIAIHWGTFEDLADEPLDQPPIDLKIALDQKGIANKRFQVMKHGETLIWKNF